MRIHLKTGIFSGFVDNINRIRYNKFQIQKKAYKAIIG